MLQTEVLEKIKTHILCSVTISEIMWTNVVEQDRLQVQKGCEWHAG